MFNLFPTIFYKISDFDYLKVKDITFAAKLKSFVEKYKLFGLRPYIVRNGERPDQVSFRIYEVTKFDYILLLVNNIVDPYKEWPMSYQIFNEYIEAKYGSINAAKSTDNGVYYNGNGITLSRKSWIELSDNRKYFKTFYEYENELNTAKSFINFIDYGTAVKFEVDLQKMMSSYRQAEL